MQTPERSTPWTIRLARGLETVLFTAATLVVAAGVLMMFLRPTVVLA
jgi:hypothetical protein